MTRAALLDTDFQSSQPKEEYPLTVRARDGNVLDIVRKNEALNFGQWTEFFSENHSKPPIRELKTHAANLRATKHLRTAFGTRRLLDITTDDIELFLREHLRQRIRRLETEAVEDAKRVSSRSTFYADKAALRHLGLWPPSSAQVALPRLEIPPLNEPLADHVVTTSEADNGTGRVL